MKSAANKGNEMGAGGNSRGNPLLKVDVTEPMKIAELEYHPLHDKFVGDAVTVNLEGMAESIRQNGMLDPITILPKSKLVIDGFHRIEAAKIVGLKVVPVRRAKAELTEEQVLKLMYQSLVHRKHVTKQQRVALWVTCYGGEETFKANYKRDKGPLPEGSDLITNQMIAAQFGEKPNTVSKYVNEVLFPSGDEKQETGEANAEGKSELETPKIPESTPKREHDPEVFRSPQGIRNALQLFQVAYQGGDERVRKMMREAVQELIRFFDACEGGAT
ncbi:ParB/Srx family N-terminal domain-containing protein [Turneriella parva]|uniref:ParB domain protein nuclease n=1 Tax=Turneriella parva (strain ATCC BAA-1111 / DSM 21527 / NCTC 11395 / H) TaxID=869212 RepID=I4B0C3_TURPD|nr:ParB/Srx family N-terminal domain-containing protein [Turneriella parva]AFM10730.1 ParB domain protein nuclease [Turneriella parva DSM 21527]